MEFEEFSRQFRQRTMQRMREFERALAQAQTRVEVSARVQPTTPASPTPETRQSPRRGRVQGVLRRD